MIPHEDLKLLFGNVYHKQSQKSNNKPSRYLDYVTGKELISLILRCHLNRKKKKTSTRKV